MEKHLRIGLKLLVFTAINFLVIFSCKEKDPLIVTGNIEGTISDMETNSFLQGVNVSLTSNGNSTFIEQSKATGSDGKFSYKDIEAGSYKLSFKRDGYEDNSKNISLLAGQTSSSDIGLKPVKPKLTVSKTELNFGTAETNLAFQIDNSGKGELKWEVKENIDWLSVNPSSGVTTSQTSAVSVIINRDVVLPGNYERTISVTSNGGNAEILIKVVIEGPKLDVSPLNLDFNSDLNKKTLLIKNVGVGSLDYTVSTDVTWISIIPNSGTVTKETDQIEVSISRNGMSYGNFSGKINILSKGGNASVDVKMTVLDPNIPQLSITPKEMNFGNKDVSMILTVKNSGKGILQWSLTDNQTWIDENRNSGSLASSQTVDVTVSADRKGLAPNNYSGLINITSNGGNETCNVQMEVAAAPVLSYDPTVLDFGYSKDNLIFTIKNSGTGDLNWTLTKNKDWINLSEIAGTNQSSITVTIDKSKLAVGIFSGQVSIASNGGSANIVINVEKRNPNTAPKLDFTVSPSSGFLETNFALSITSSDDYTSSSNLLYRWKWQDEDQFTNWSTANSSSRTYTTSGTKNITVEVKDQDEAISTLTKSVVVSKNEKPLASFTVSPISGLINTVFTVDANGSSDDFTSKGNLQVRWKWEDNGSFSNWTTIKTATHTYTLASAYTITLEVKDETGLVSSITQKVTIDESDREPNDSKDQAQMISLNGKINGTIGYSVDACDYYTFTPTENGNIYLSFKNKGPGYYNGGCYLYADGFDVDRFGYDFDYITAIPRMTSGIKENSETVPICRGVKYYIRIKNDRFSNPIPYEFSTSFIPISEKDTGEPNDNAASATVISLNSTITALIGYSDDDEDYYLFTPIKDGNFSFTIKNLHPSGISSGSIGECSLLRLGDVNSIIRFYYGVSVGTSQTSNIVGIIKDVKYIIKVTKYSPFESAPYELKTTFQ